MGPLVTGHTYSFQAVPFGADVALAKGLVGDLGFQITSSNDLTYTYGGQPAFNVVAVWHGANGVSYPDRVAFTCSQWPNTWPCGFQVLGLVDLSAGSAPAPLPTMLRPIRSIRNRGSSMNTSSPKSRFFGLGQANQAVVSIVSDPSSNAMLQAAANLISALGSFGGVQDCANPSILNAVGAFQSSANAIGASQAVGGSALSQDCNYGPLTAGVLNAVIAATQQIGVPISASPAPAALFVTGPCNMAVSCAGIPAPAPSPQPAPAPSPPPPTPAPLATTTSSSLLPLLLIGAVAIAALGGAIWYAKKDKRHAKKAAHEAWYGQPRRHRRAAKLGARRRRRRLYRRRDKRGRFIRRR